MNAKFVSVGVATDETGAVYFDNDAQAVIDAATLEDGTFDFGLREVFLPTTAAVDKWLQEVAEQVTALTGEGLALFGKGVAAVQAAVDSGEAGYVLHWGLDTDFAVAFVSKEHELVGMLKGEEDFALMFAVLD